MLDQTGADAPTLCLVPTADEGDLAFTETVTDALAGSAVTVTRLLLYPRPNVADPAGLVEAADAVVVSGGSTVSLLALWRAHGIDAVLRRAWEEGTVLGGFSAGALCWFEGGLTDSFGPGLAPLRGGLGLLPGSFCPHYENEPRRRRFHDEIGRATLAPGLACDNGVTVHFVGRDVAGVHAEVDGARAWRVGVDGRGDVVESPLASRP